VVPIRGLVNTFFYLTLNYYDNQQEISTIQFMDIKINTSTGCSTISSANNSRESSYSDKFSMNYIDKVKELANDSS